MIDGSNPLARLNPVNGEVLSCNEAALRNLAGTKTHSLFWLRMETWMLRMHYMYRESQKLRPHDEYEAEVDAFVEHILSRGISIIT